MMRYLFFSCSLFLSVVFYSQPNYKKDSIQIKVLLDKAEQIATENSSEGIKICQKALAISHKKKYYQLDNFAYNVLGRIYSARGNAAQSKLYLNKAIALSEKYNDDPMRCASYCDMGSLLVFESKNLEAIAYFTKSLQIAEKIKDDELSFYNLYYISDLYFSEHNIEKSFEYSFKALAKLKNKGAKYDYHRGAIYDQLGKTYSLKNNYAAAKSYLTKSLFYYHKIKEDFGIANSTYDLYRNEFALNKKASIDSLITHVLFANKLFEAIAPDSRNTINCLNFLSELYLEKGQSEKDKTALAKALHFALRSQVLCKQAGFVSANIDCQKLLSTIYYAQGDFKKAYEAHTVFYQLNDSLFSQEHKNELAKLESTKDIIIKNKQLKIKSIALESKEKQKWFLLTLLVFFATLGILLFYQNSNRKKTNDKLVQLNAELHEANSIKTRFFNIINHDLRSPVSNLIDFLHLQKDSPDLLDNDTKERISTTTLSSAENLLSSMEDILLWSKGQMENFQPQPKEIAVNQLFEDTKKVFSGYHKIHFVYSNVENISIVTDENYLKTIIRNLTSNAINVFAATPNPTIIWKAWRHDENIYVSITDNGSGATTEQFRALYDDKEVVGIATGLGLHLIRDLAKAIHCEIHVDSKLNQGTTFTLKFTS